MLICEISFCTSLQWTFSLHKLVENVSQFSATKHPTVCPIEKHKLLIDLHYIQCRAFTVCSILDLSLKEISTSKTQSGTKLHKIPSLLVYISHQPLSSSPWATNGCRVFVFLNDRLGDNVIPVHAKLSAHSIKDCKVSVFYCRRDIACSIKILNNNIKVEVWARTN